MAGGAGEVRLELQELRGRIEQLENSVTDLEQWASEDFESTAASSINPEVPVIGQGMCSHTISSGLRCLQPGDLREKLLSPYLG